MIKTIREGRKGSEMVNNNVRSTTEKKQTKITNNRKGNDGGDNTDVNACEREPTKPKGDSIKKKNKEQLMNK